MNIGIIGSTGFIGKAFIDKYCKDFDLVYCLVRNKPDLPITSNCIFVIGSMNNEESINELVRNVDVLLHFGFDHTYKHNISGIHLILNSLTTHKVQKLIYLSSYVVYDLDCGKEIDESCPPSKLNDIYTSEKRSIENILNNFASTNPQFFILNIQPTIVFGFNSTWSNMFIFANKHNIAELPNKGNNFGPFVYINDLIDSIFLGIQSFSNNLPSNYVKTLVSGHDNLTWQDLYLLHRKVIKSLGKPCGEFSIVESKGGRYGNDLFQDILINLFFIIRKIKFFSYTSSYLISFLKKKKKIDIDIHVMDKSPSSIVFRTFGLSKVLHSYNVKVNTSKASKVIGYKPKYLVSESFVDITDQYKSQFDKQ